MQFHFQSPMVLLLFLILPLMFVYMRWVRKRSRIVFSSLEIVNAAKPGRSFFARYVPIVLRICAIACFIIALARPQLMDEEREYETEGIDIVLALDISGSMKAEDFQPANRLEVAKEEAKKFILGREHDRIGLVVFAQQSYTQCPLTLDYDVLLSLLDQVQIGLIKDGTAIGLAIANAINRLRDSTASSKVIILLTDGENNSGQIDPITAAELAKTFGIKIYTIGVGREGLVPYPIDDPLFGRRYTNVEVNIDEKTLLQIADMTDGLYFRARDQQSLKQIYEKIDRLEKTEVKVTEYTNYFELFHYLAVPGLFFLLLELILTNTVLLKLP